MNCKILFDNAKEAPALWDVSWNYFPDEPDDLFIVSLDKHFFWIDSLTYCTNKTTIGFATKH